MAASGSAPVVPGEPCARRPDPMSDSRKRARNTISVSSEFFTSLRAWCDARGLAMSSLAEQALSVATGLPLVPHASKDATARHRAAFEALVMARPNAEEVWETRLRAFNGSDAVGAADSSAPTDLVDTPAKVP